MQSEWLNFCDPMDMLEGQRSSIQVVHSSSIAKGWRRCDDEAEMKSAKNIAINTALGEDLLRFTDDRKFGTILCDPPWQFQNRMGKVAPEHRKHNVGIRRTSECKRR